jgi:citrate synthase
MDRADPARGRLAVLSAHLAPSSGEAAAGLQRSPVSAAVPGPRAGALSVVDARTGKRHEVKVSEDGTVRATDFKKVPTDLCELEIDGSDDGAPCCDPGELLEFWAGASVVD